MGLSTTSRLSVPRGACFSAGTNVIIDVFWETRLVSNDAASLTPAASPCTQISPLTHLFIFPVFQTSLLVLLHLFFLFPSSTALPTHKQNTENRRRFKANLPAMPSHPDENRSRQENSLWHGPQRILECVPFSEHPCTSMISAISSHTNCFRFSPTILLALDRRRKTASKIDLERERESERERAPCNCRFCSSRTFRGKRKEKRKTLK